MIKRWIRRQRVRIGPDGARVLALHDDLEGKLSFEESAWLFHAARGMRRIVEIGSFRGKSCVLLALGSRETGGHVTAIDPHVNFANAKSSFDMSDHDAMVDALRRHGVAERVTKLVATSEGALPQWDGGPIDLLWVDGDHNYPAVKFDLEAWGKFVRVGGIIAAHDYKHLEDVRRAWRDVVEADPRWGPSRFVRSIAWARRER